MFKTEELFHIFECLIFDNIDTDIVIFLICNTLYLAVKQLNVNTNLTIETIHLSVIAYIIR